MQKFIFISILILTWGCSHKRADNTANTEYIDKLISERISLLENKNKTSDSVSFDVRKITADINKLILLSKDVENIEASINQSNSYFENAQKKYDLDSISYIKLSKDIHLEDITGFIRKNELNLLNKIILKANKNGALMLTAQ